MYKHILGKSWPKEERHCDGISILSGSVIKRMVSDYTDYLNEMNLEFSIRKFLKVCGLRTVSEMIISFREEMKTIDCKTDLDRSK